MKNHFTLLCFMLITVINTAAPTTFITTGVAGTPAYFAEPVYRSAAASASDTGRFSYLYPVAELSAVGIIDVGALALVTPGAAANNCYSSTEPVTVQIRNYSTDPINFAVSPVTVTTTVTGAVIQTLTATINSGTLAPATTQHVTMSGTLNMNAPGVYTFNATAVVTGDVTAANNAMPAVNITKAALSAGTASASQTFYCVSGGTPTLTATGMTGYSNIQWQQSTTAGSGFTNIPGAFTTPYTVGSAITQTMYYRLQATCNGNTINSNEVTVTLNNPQITGTTPGASCGPGPVTLSATGTGSVFTWYAAATGGVALGTGTTFTTPPISANTPYYVSTGSASGGIINVGLPAAIAGTSGSGTTNFGIVFNALVPFTLSSVVIYPVAGTSGTPGTVTIDVINSAGVVLHTATVNVIGFPASSASAQTVILNFNIAAGTNLKLRPRSFTGITGLLFEPGATAPPSGNYGYPFTVPGVVSLTSSTLFAAPANIPRFDLYYYFYNWQIVSGCESPRTAVLATVTTQPAATISYTGTSYCTTAGTATVTHTGTTGGTYSAAPAGLSINSSTGTVTPGTSTPGNYTVSYSVAASGGCAAFTTTAPITILTASVAPTIATASNPTMCGTGGVTDLTATVGSLNTSASYKWYTGSCGGTVLGTGAVLTGIPVSTTTTFYVRAEGGCGNSSCASVTVTVNPLLSVVLTFPTLPNGATQTNPMRPSGLYTTVSPAGTYTYVWTLNGTVLPVTASSITPANGLFNAFGTYVVTATNTVTGCSATSNAITVTDIERERGQLFITFNPATTTINIQFFSNTSATQARLVSLYTSSGQKLMDKAFTPSGVYGIMTLDMSKLPSGTYMVILSDGDNKKIASAGVVKL